MNINSYKEYLTSKGGSLGEIRKKQSDMLMDRSFSADPTYRKGMLYNANLEPIEVVEFKFQKAQTYTINKDQVEYFVQFKTDYHPEKKLNVDDKIYRLYDDEKERLSFYLDIPDDNGDIYKWLIVGRNNDNAFVRYNVLQCNWTFEWIINKRYYSCLGVMRSRNNYNSGVWSDGFTQTVENQTAFFVPTNDSTRTINYDLRFMITDNPIHPKTYEVSKVEDTFPLGVLKLTLVQDHYNAHTDVCRILDDPDTPDILNDGKVHMICNYTVPEIPIEDIEEPDDDGTTVNPTQAWYLSEVEEKLYINSKAQIIHVLNDSGNKNFDHLRSWQIYLDDVQYQFEDLTEYFELIKDEENNTLSIKAIHQDLAGYIVKISITDNYGVYCDSVEMEVVN